MLFIFPGFDINFWTECICLSITRAYDRWETGGYALWSYWDTEKGNNIDDQHKNPSDLFLAKVSTKRKQRAHSLD